MNHGLPLPWFHRADIETYPGTFVLGKRKVKYNSILICRMHISYLRSEYFTAKLLYPFCNHGFHRKKTPAMRCLFGDPDENRTRVTAVKGRCLSRLTTGPWKSGYNKFRELFGSLNWWRKWDLNLWPAGYEPDALANWAIPPYWFLFGAQLLYHVRHGLSTFFRKKAKSFLYDYNRYVTVSKKE